MGIRTTNAVFDIFLLSQRNPIETIFLTVLDHFVTIYFAVTNVLKDFLSFLRILEDFPGFIRILSSSVTGHNVRTVRISK